MTRFFTTGQVAKMCHVAPRTVAKWFESGRFPGSYRLPDSKDRRIPEDSLIRFIKVNGMTLPPELRAGGPLVVWHRRHTKSEDLRAKQFCTETDFHLGFLCADRPFAVVLDANELGGCGRCRDLIVEINRKSPKTLIVVVTTEDAAKAFDDELRVRLIAASFEYPGRESAIAEFLNRLLEPAEAA